MGSEVGLWQGVRSRLAPFGRIERREDRLIIGAPDVLYCLRPAPGAAAVTGQIELKHLHAWPSRAGTRIKFTRFTQHQAEYLRSWWQAGGASWLLAQIGHDYLLIGGYRAAVVQAGLIQVDLRMIGRVWRGTLPAGELLRTLTAPRAVVGYAQIDCGASQRDMMSDPSKPAL